MLSDNANALGPFLTNKFGDRYLYEVNRYAFNQVGSEGVYRQHFELRLQGADKLYILIGGDSGVLFKFLRKGDFPEGSRYLVVELPSVLERLRQEDCLVDLPDRIAVVAPDSFWEQAKAFRFPDYVFLGAVEVLEAICTADSFLPEYRELAYSIQENVQRSAWNITAGLGQTQFIEKQLENLTENRYNAAFLRGLCAGKTAVILAGGPSLESIVPWVYANKDRVAVFAVSRISRQLVKWGLKPHFVFSVDPQDTSFDVSREMLQFDDGTLFINAYHVSPLLLGQWLGRNLYLGPRFPWETPLNPVNLSADGPTVTNTALSVAVEMGFSQVVFGGVDLCYSSTGITHVGGSNESSAGPRLGDTYTIDTNDGGSAETGPDYVAAITIMGGQAKNARHRGSRIINPTPRSAKIPNVDHLPLEEIVIEPFDPPFGDLVRGLLSAETSDQLTEFYRTVLAELERVGAELGKIRKLVEEALDCNARLFGHYGRKGDFKNKIRMDKIERCLNRDFANLVHLIKRYGIRDFLKIVRPGGRENWTQEEIEKAGRVYYEAYRESTDKLLDLVGSARERVVARLAEEEAEPDFDLLAAQWRKDNQPGRVRVWRRHHPDACTHLTDRVNDLFTELERLFAKQVSYAETGQMKKVRKKRSLAGVNGRAQRLFQSGDQTGLLRLRDGLAVHPDRSGAEPLEHLVAGYLAELSGKADEALAHYEKLVGETFEPLTELALKRILSISLGRKEVDLALSALDCLANAALVYKPQYAEMLRILGRLQDAADVYTDYLEAAPTDLAALIKLGQIYRAMKQEEVASQIFGMVLEQDPKNGAARALLSVEG